MPQAEGVAEHVRNARPEAVQPGKRILPHDDHKVAVNILAVDRPGELDIKLVVCFGMIEKILLELVEDGQEGAAGFLGGLE